MNTPMDVAPFAGPLGKEIVAKVSQEDWEAWRQMQTKIINEYRLDLSESVDRQKLLQQMRSFLKLDSEGEEMLQVGTPV
ncbi:MAG: Fe(2+)-trafficking protein [Myxococcaceae bacterium]|nr:Fe(2+)-trafficking protein [Myxococcaceae bacterium]MBH2006070.1 Fe(2+)-trafficking protein [Myxococcaceae bacterium]